MKSAILLLSLVLLGALAGYAIYALLYAAPGDAPPPGPAEPPVSPPGEAPAESGISVTFISAPDCEPCNAEGYVIKQAQVIMLQRSEVPFESVRTLEASDPEAAGLISRHGIMTLPAVIMEGPLEDHPDLIYHWTETLGVYTGEALVSAPIPPYHELASGAVTGIVKGIAINPADCRWCSDGGSFLASLHTLPASMVFSETVTYAQGDPEAAELIGRHNITRLPTILLSEDAAAYPIYPDLALLGDVSEGWFVLRNVPPPFVDLEANETRGMVKTIYLFDQSCAECFDIRGFAAYLADATGLVIEQETYFDVRADDGAALARRYGVTHIPTLILSPDVEYYPGFSEFWVAQGNKIGEDGWYVFSSHELLGDMVYMEFSG